MRSSKPDSNRPAAQWSDSCVTHRRECFGSPVASNDRHLRPLSFSKKMKPADRTGFFLSLAFRDGLSVLHAAVGLDLK